MSSDIDIMMQTYQTELKQLQRKKAALLKYGVIHLIQKLYERHQSRVNMPSGFPVCFEIIFLISHGGNADVKVVIGNLRFFDDQGSPIVFDTPSNDIHREVCAWLESNQDFCIQEAESVLSHQRFTLHEQV